MPSSHSITRSLVLLRCFAVYRALSGCWCFCCIVNCWQASTACLATMLRVPGDQYQPQQPQQALLYSQPLPAVAWILNATCRDCAENQGAANTARDDNLLLRRFDWVKAWYGWLGWCVWVLHQLLAGAGNGYYWTETLNKLTIFTFKLQHNALRYH